MAEYPGSTSRDYTTTASGVADDASVSIAAVAGEHICIQRIDFSSAADGAHTLTIKEDTAAAPASYNQTKWTLQITKGGPGPIMGNDAPVYVGTKGRGIQVALATNSSTTGSVNVLHY